MVELKRQPISPDLANFLDLVVEKFRETEIFLNIEEAAEKLAKEEGMEHFVGEVPTIRKQLKEFLGEEKWEQIRDEEGYRHLDADRKIVSGTAG